MRALWLLMVAAGSGSLQRPPTGFTYVYWVDANGQNQLVTNTDANGVTRPVYAAGTGS